MNSMQRSLDSNDMLKSNSLLFTLTNDSIEIMNTAREQIAVGQDLRNKSLCLMKECFDNAKSINNNVDEAFVRKIAETLGLNVNTFTKELSSIIIQAWILIFFRLFESKTW